MLQPLVPHPALRIPGRPARVFDQPGNPQCGHLPEQDFQRREPNQNRDQNPKPCRHHATSLFAAALYTPKAVATTTPKNSHSGAVMSEDSEATTTPPQPSTPVTSAVIDFRYFVNTGNPSVQAIDVAGGVI
jgi:hypothetical protein